jgi:hypothetical protein
MNPRQHARMTMPALRRSALLIALFAALSSRAFACEPKPLNDTDESFALAAAKRMTRLGVTDVEPAAPLKDGGELYVLLGSNVRLAIRDDGGYPTEVGTVLSEPSNSDDRNRQVALISFMLARIGGGAEAQITKMLEASFAAHRDNGTWTERVGDAAVVFTRSEGGLVARIGLCR